MKKVERIFKALSDKNRLRIIKMLEHRQLCVCEITDVLGLATSTVSKHLSILTDAGLIVGIKDGKWVDYKINIEQKGIEARQVLAILPLWMNDEKQIISDLDKLRDTNRDAICCSK